MTPYEIITIPNPALKKTAEAVEHINEDIQNQLERMTLALENAGGIGLAANQIGVLNRVVLVDVPEGCWSFGEEQSGVLPILAEPTKKEALTYMINPEIVWESEQKSIYEEGCLSIPGQYANVIRPAFIKVKYLDENGQEKEIEAAGLHAHCIQHEIDHLNGTLFIDHLSSLKRNMIVKKFKKQHRI